ncbi:MAG: hypothetical protein AAGD05_11200 [Bacteroidota bacterium]
MFRLVVWFLCGLLPACSTAQDSLQQRLFRSELQVGVLAGGQIENLNFVSETGLLLSFRQYRVVHPQLLVGAGMAFHRLNDERFIPLFISSQLFFRPGPRSAFWSTNLGYAWAWDDTLSQLEDFKLRGGWYVDTAFGWSLALNTRLRYSLSLGLTFQRARLETEALNGDPFSDALQFYLLTFKTGISF